MNSDMTDVDRVELLASLRVSDCDEVLRMWSRGIDRELLFVADALMCRDVRRLGGGTDDMPTNVLLAAMVSCLNQGSLCLPLDPGILSAEIDRICGQTGASGPGEFTVARIGEMVDQCLALIDAGAKLFVDEAATRGGRWPIRCDSGRLYFARLFDRERHLLERLRLLRDAEPAPLIHDDPDFSKLKAVIDSVSGFRGETLDGLPCVVNLNSAQKQAVMLALRKRFLVVSGGPGTGKTRILASLLVAWRKAVIDRIPDMAERENAARNILFVAPTGRAGKRMSESIAAALGAMVGFNPDDTIGRQFLNMTGMTIHRALGFNPRTGRTTYSAEKRLPYDIIVCDEVSMVDVAMMDNLVTAMRDDARLVFMGDRDQLPSVEAGAVLGDIIPRRQLAGQVADFVPVFTKETVNVSKAVGILPPPPDDTVVFSEGEGPMADAVVMLSRSYRTGGNVTGLAGMVNAGRTAAFSDPSLLMRAAELCFPEAFSAGRYQCFVVEGIKARAPVRKKIMAAWLKHLYRGVPEALDGSGQGGASEQVPDSLDAMFRRIARVDFDSSDLQGSTALMKRLFAVLGRGRILCALREGPFGASGLNRLASEVAGTKEQLFPGCPVMITRNMHGLKLYNGETGVVMKQDGVLVAVFQQGEGFVSHPLASLGTCLPAFAGTVHKSQGSEYQNVIVVLPEEPDHRLMTREILYTAMTRSSNNVWIMGGRDVLSAAIGRRTSRYSGLDLWS